MSNKDTISHDYMSDNERFADVFNYFIYGGKQIIKPENLTEADVTESSVMKDSKGIVTNKKIRDLLKNLTVKRDKNAVYAILGIENQSLIHYAMPVRALVYDALNYDSQVSAERKRLKNSKEKLTEEELLSGFSKNSKLIPVITLVINWSGKKWEAPKRSVYSIITAATIEHSFHREGKWGSKGWLNFFHITLECQNCEKIGNGLPQVMYALNIRSFSLIDLHPWNSQH